jgi:hypothetical protein
MTIGSANLNFTISAISAANRTELSDNFFFRSISVLGPQWNKMWMDGGSILMPTFTLPTVRMSTK